MNLSFQSFLVIVSSLSFFLVMVYFLRMIVVKFKNKKIAKSRVFLHKIINSELTDRESNWNSKNVKKILDRYIELSQTITLKENQLKIIQDFFKNNKIDLFYYKKLNKKSIFKRCEAARYLGYIDSQVSKNGLMQRLITEPEERVKTYIIHSITLLNFSGALPNIIDSLKNSSENYINQVTGIIRSFRGSFIALFPILKERNEPEIIKILIEFAKVVPTEESGDFLIELFNRKSIEKELREKTFFALVDSFPAKFSSIEYIHDSNQNISDYAIMGLSRTPTNDIINTLVELTSEDEYSDIAIKSLSNIIKKGTKYFLVLNDLFLKEKRQNVITSLIKVVANRIDYYLPLMNSQKADQYEFIIKEVLKSGRVSNIITFLNENHDKEIESRILKLVSQTIKEFKLDTNEFQIYLKESILFNIGLSKKEMPKKRINEKNEGVNSGPLYVILFFVVITLPLFYLNVYLKGGDISQWYLYIKVAINDFLLIFGYYCLALNIFYYLLFILSFLNSRKQYRYWKIKDESFLFSEKRLPSLSILVPGYCEEETIIDNILSLLNLRYPDYEVIVINDGSSDNTLQVLIDYFKLEKEDKVYNQRLKTQPVRGIYYNKNIPELTVIDKINGGKADSLNVGLNLATKDYFAGIDSDSLLERDALLILASSFLDQKYPVAAAGGNIMPVNGCNVDRGVLEKISLPSHPVALLQNIEYIRSFMNGRMGWAYMNTLLIISGAFGIFRREDILRINGYLTSREIYLKDTVGEDMELVVRLSRNLKERKEKYSLLYLFLANCWTEVPQSLKILRKQRERWQRGLIDILSFHKKMNFNPKYGSIGLLGFPYYLIAEVIGPWYEFIANIIFIIGISIGWVSLPILFLVIGANFILSFSLSLSSILIMDWEGSIFSVKDRLILILTSLLETLGFRQMVSFYRIAGFMGVIRNITGWGAMKRSGFKK